MLSKLNSLSHALGELALNGILPPLCHGCRRPLREVNKICPSCWQEIEFIVEPFCEINGTPLPFDIGKGTISAAAIAEPPVYRRARTVAEYSGTMRNLIHQFKYCDDLTTTELFTTWLLRAGSELINSCDIIIPIPLHPMRLWKRRYNQAALLSHSLANRTNRNIDCNSLIRTRPTKSQVGLSETDRETNVKGAFQLRNKCNKQVKNRSVLLIDDIITTGTTIKSAANCLLLNGASEVNVLCLARVTRNKQIIN